jgi:MFS transporter, ACS family, tartrate transporter
MTQDVEKSAMAKIYIRLLPFAILSYFLAYVDRINVSFAALTMRDDLQMSASAYGFALGTFYWAYFIFRFLGENCGRLGVHVRWRRAATT